MLSADELERFRSGDGDAVRAVYRQYGRLVHAVALSQLGSASLAEEATQLTFVKAWKAAASIEPGRDIAPWLATIARRTAIDLYRAESRHAAVTIDEVSPGHPALVQTSSGIERYQDVWQVRQAIDDLPDDERVVVQLQHLEGMPHSAIAEQLGVPIGTVKSRSHRAHKRLALKLGHLKEEFY